MGDWNDFRQESEVAVGDVKDGGRGWTIANDSSRKQLIRIDPRILHQTSLRIEKPEEVQPFVNLQVNRSSLFGRGWPKIAQKQRCDLLYRQRQTEDMR